MRDDFTFAASLGDVDGDGDPDLVVGNWSSPILPGYPDLLLLNDGNGVFTDAPAGMLPVDQRATLALVLVDVDGDSDLDIATADAGESARLYLNDGSGRFTARPDKMPGLVDSGRAIAFADVDGDGDADLALGNMNRQNRLFLNDGSGKFIDSMLLPATSDMTSGLALADLDGDGDEDLVTVNRGQRDRLENNLSRQVDTPYLAVGGRIYRIDTYARPAGTSAFAQMWLALRALAQPIALPPYGVFHLDPTVLIDIGQFRIDPIEGVGSFALRLPIDPRVVGTELFFQALVFDPARPFSARLTNLDADRWR